MLSPGTELLTADEVADILRLTPASVRRLLTSGTIPGRKVGGVWRVPKDALLEALFAAADATTNSPKAAETAA